jgi:hypothetical protein
VQKEWEKISEGVVLDPEQSILELPDFHSNILFSIAKKYNFALKSK